MQAVTTIGFDIAKLPGLTANGLRECAMIKTATRSPKYPFIGRTTKEVIGYGPHTPGCKD